MRSAGMQDAHAECQKEAQEGLVKGSGGHTFVSEVSEEGGVRRNARKE